MAFRFRHRFQIFPGLTLNLGKTGVSASLGIRGAHVTFGSKGTRTTVGLPGTGMSWTNYQPHHQPQSEEPVQHATLDRATIDELVAGATKLMNSTLEQIAEELKKPALSEADRDELCGCRYLIKEAGNKHAATVYDNDVEQLFADHERLLAISDQVDVIYDRYMDPAAKELMESALRKAREEADREEADSSETWRTVAASSPMPDPLVRPVAGRQRFTKANIAALTVGLLLAVVIAIPLVGMTVSHVANPNDGIRVMEDPEPEKPKAPQAEPEKPKAIAAKTRRPAVVVCGPDHWQKDHWEPSCR